MYANVTEAYAFVFSRRFMSKLMMLYRKVELATTSIGLHFIAQWREGLSVKKKWHVCCLKKMMQNV